MLDRMKMVKRKLEESIEQLCEVSWMFSKQPEKDFTRNRKLSFLKLVSFLLAMEGGTLTTELLKRFGYSLDTASASALVQQRSKLAPETFPALFDLFVRKTQPIKLYKGFRLFAADGSDIQIPNNPGHISSHYLGANGQAPYNILHLDAIYDLLQCTYQDASLVGDREDNEQASLCRMVDRSAAEKALIIMDRGYEGYNLFGSDTQIFPPMELKKLYAMRWGIESSSRKLKYTVGLLHFHAKKVEHIYQEVFARLIMYNFTELITSPVIIQKADAKYGYKANFTVAVHVCRQFFLGNVSPPDVEAVIRRNISPIRPGRSSPRNMTVKHTVSLLYRVA